ncbi:MAG: manganese-dependent inorganic pyrophosphatase [Patescibacteria group bacterium]
MLKVFGHQSPDTDTTCSAIIWSWYLNEHTGAESKPYILGTLNKETEFVLRHWEVGTPELLESVEKNDSVVIVDTNNPQELFENINSTNVVEIIDHHKLVGGISTETPPRVTMRPLACTATILYDLMAENEVEPPKHIAGLILSCILSDTLEFRSPTTTPHDKDVAESLAKQLKIDVHKYASEMFAAKSDISDFSDSGLIKLDSKKYEVGDVNLRVSVIETTDPATVLERKVGIVKAISELLNEEKDVDDVLFFIVDILKEEATVLTYSELTKEIISKSFGVSVETDTEVLPGIVSRKKQILPVLKK